MNKALDTTEYGYNVKPRRDQQQTYNKYRDWNNNLKKDNFQLERTPGIIVEFF